MILPTYTFHPQQSADTSDPSHNLRTCHPERSLRNEESRVSVNYKPLVSQLPNHPTNQPAGDPYGLHKQ